MQLGLRSNVQIMTFRDAILGRSRLFKLFGRIASNANRDVLVEEYIRPIAGEHVLDIGCGYGDLSSRLHDVIYIGIDMSPKYIRHANQHYGNFGRFICGDITNESAFENLGHFDIVAIIGVLHHLSDNDCRTLLSFTRRILNSTGRLITLDGVFTEDQSALARLFLRLDRGRFIRMEEHYRNLISEQFDISVGDIRPDLSALPFTHFATICHPK
jgi:SAM-dependent methyltransferase